MSGFAFAYRESGGYPTVQKVAAKNAVALTRGDLANIETGTADLAATADTALAGAVQQTVDAATPGEVVEVITDEDAVYSVVDNNARVLGATLDIAGATGAQGVAATSNADLVVVAPSSATEATLVRIVPSQHVKAGK